MTRLVLLEHAPEGFVPEPDDLIVALTPEACFELDRRDVDYRVPPDFGTDERIAALEPLHWRQQLAWIRAFDEVVAAHVPGTERWRFGAATAYAYELKTLLDPVRISSLELDLMLGGCDRVLLHRRAQTAPPVSRQLFFQGPSVTSLVLPFVAAARGIAYEERLHEGATRPAVTAPAGGPADHDGFLRRVTVRLSWRSRRARWRGLTRPMTKRLTLLFADFGYDLPDLLTQALRQGHRCLRVVDDAVVEETKDRPEIGRLPVEGADAGWHSAAAAIAPVEHPLWDWPNSWLSGATLADILRPRIVSWLREVMPVTAARAAALHELITAEGIDLVVSANTINPDVIAAAAVTTHPTQSVLIDHGHAAHASAVWDLLMLRYVDHNFCATRELAQYMESRRPLYNYPTAEVHVASYRWRANAALSRRGRPPEPVPDGKPVVVYALTSTGGNARYLNSAWYSDGWYYRLCREIVDVLAHHSEIHSVVKPFPSDGLIRNPVDLYVDDLGLDHVVSSRAPLRAWIPWASRVVFDYPSTGLYETAAAGVPYLALLYTHHPFRREAVEQLGPAAAHFSAPAEAAGAVEAFVAAPDPSAPRFAPEGEEILATLERIARR